MSKIIQKTLIQAIAQAFAHWCNCTGGKNPEWESITKDRLDDLINMMPRGSGIDDYPKLDFEKSTPNKLVFEFGYHHMSEHGYYDGWTEHVLTVTPSFDGFDLKISGKDRNQIKDYLYDCFHCALSAIVWMEYKGKDSEWKLAAYNPIPSESVESA